MVTKLGSATRRAAFRGLHWRSRRLAAAHFQLFFHRTLVYLYLCQLAEEAAQLAEARPKEEPKSVLSSYLHLRYDPNRFTSPSSNVKVIYVLGHAKVLEHSCLHCTALRLRRIQQISSGCYMAMYYRMVPAKCHATRWKRRRRIRAYVKWASTLQYTSAVLRYCVWTQHTCRTT
jgi:hypothetical protein